MTQVVNIERLDSTDADDALRLSQQAGWSMRTADWELLLSADAVVAVGGRHGSELVATTTVVQYGDIGWVGCVLVDEAYRRQGLGTQIFQSACEAATTPVLGLDANPAGKSMYRDSGFREVMKVSQYEGTPRPARPPDVREVAAADLDELIRFDRVRTGVDRGWLLREFTDDSSTPALARRDGDLGGYTVLRPSRDGWNLGPIVADTVETTRALVRRAACEAEGQITVRVPDVSTAEDVKWEELGFTFQRALDRMVRPPGGAPLTGSAVRAISSFAFG